MEKWLAGRRTYILAGLIVSTAVLLVFLGELTPETASAIALIALGGFAASFRAALDRHQAETIQVLREVALAGMEMSARNVPALIAATSQAVQDGAKLADECGKESR